MNKSALSFIALISLIGAIVVIALLQRDNTEYREDAIRFKEKYEALNGSEVAPGMVRQTITIPRDNPFVFANMDQIVELVENGSGIIYFGFPECPWCRTAVPAMIEAAAELGIEEIFYMNMTPERNIKIINDEGEIEETRAGTPGYMRLLELLEPYLMDYTITGPNGETVDLNQKRIFVPFVLIVREGNVIAHKFYTLPIQDETPFMVFTPEQHQELVDLYIALFNQYLNLTDTCQGIELC